MAREWEERGFWLEMAVQLLKSPHPFLLSHGHSQHTSKHYPVPEKHFSLGARQ